MITAPVSWRRFRALGRHLVLAGPDSCVATTVAPEEGTTSSSFLSGGQRENYEWRPAVRGGLAELMVYVPLEEGVTRPESRST